VRMIWGFVLLVAGTVTTFAGLFAPRLTPKTVRWVLPVGILLMLSGCVLLSAWEVPR
jgi:hypothetical protein